jgi:DNA-binding beta-propeller fold protein YncE
VAAPGAAPRHLAFHPNGAFAYQCNELSSTVTTFAYDTATGQLDELDVQTTLPRDFSDVNTTAEIQIAPSGKFVYVSNRGHNTITIFQVDDATGRLTPVAWEPTQGEQPRFSRCRRTAACSTPRTRPLTPSSRSAWTAGAAPSLQRVRLSRLAARSVSYSRAPKPPAGLWLSTLALSP